MIEGPIREDQVFEHIDSGTHYIVITAGGVDRDTSARMKVDDPIHNTGSWVTCVIYRNPEIPDQIFVRSENNFRAKFRRVT